MAPVQKPKVTLSSEMEDIDASSSYDEGEFQMDVKGYFLIRINPDTRRLEVGHCRQNNVILKKWSANSAKELCQSILKSGVVSRLDHAAYLGRETMKAEIARRLKIPYVQDSDLKL
ncbi:DUF4346 domain-containing protein [Candidatus Woesearchaeota archaeon]|nr:DUF4346 domain-containing protein [Candidatus Woesearchaeota archaeon]